MYDSVRDKNKLKLYPHKTVGTAAYLGYIVDETLLVLHPLIHNGCIGLPEDILYSKKLVFHYIQVKYNKDFLGTTRSFFKRNERIIKGIYPIFKEPRFLEIPKFGITRAIKADLEMRFDSLDIFDVAKEESEGDSKIYKLWEASISKKTNNNTRKEVKF